MRLRRQRDLYPDFAAWMREAGYAETTVRNYQRIVRRWRGSRRGPAEWLAADQAKSRARHGAPSRSATVDAAALRLWHQFRGEPKEVVTAIETPHVLRRAHPQPAAVLLPAEEAAVHAALARPGHREPQAMVVRLLQALGTRVGETTTLRLADVVTDSGGVHVVLRAEATKMRRERRVALPRETASQLDAYLRGWRATRPPSPWLFPSPHRRGVLPITTASVHGFVQQLGAQLGIVRLHPHAFRHALVSRLVTRGVSPEIVRQIVGHFSAGRGAATVLDRYIHLGPEAQRRVLEG